MSQYVALLGSINVGGNRMKMIDLQSSLEAVGLGNVSTVAASGNVLFDYSDSENSFLERLITSTVKAEFDIDIFVIVMDKIALGNSMTANPFTSDGEEKFVHNHYLNEEVELESYDKLVLDYQGYGNEKLAIGDRVLYINYVDGVGRSKLTAGFIERRLGCKGTARNLSSIRRIIGKMN